MSNIPTKHYPVIVILFVTFAATLADAFIPCMFERNSEDGRVGLDSSQIGDSSTNVDTSRRRQSFHAPTTTSLMDNNAPQRDGSTKSPTSSSPRYSQSTRRGQKSGILSSTIRESAVTAEWEPILELHCHGEEKDHPRNYFRGSYEYGGNNENRGEENDEIEVVNGVFVGYRVTKEEFVRLRSANPDDFSNE